MTRERATRARPAGRRRTASGWRLRPHSGSRRLKAGGQDPCRSQDARIAPNATLWRVACNRRPPLDKSHFLWPERALVLATSAPPCPLVARKPRRRSALSSARAPQSLHPCTFGGVGAGPAPAACGAARPARARRLPPGETPVLRPARNLCEAHVGRALPRHAPPGHKERARSRASVRATLPGRKPDRVEKPM